jgi:hypothetical protein
VEDVAKNMQQLAPELWDMLGLMLSANRHGEMQQARSFNRDVDQVMKSAEFGREMVPSWVVWFLQVAAKAYVPMYLARTIFGYTGLM